MTLRLTILDDPTETDREVVLAELRAYNIRRGGNPHVRTLAVMLTNEEGNHVGGLWGKFSYDWLFTELLAVPEEYRGVNYGKALMDKAEVIARTNGCIGVWLDTYEFQARGFYERLGFEIFGELNDHPVGQKRFFLRKLL